jgi:hypothetical protein
VDGQVGDYAAGSCLGAELSSAISRCSVANLCMTPDAVVEHLDVFKDHLPGLLMAPKAVMMQTLSLDRAKETFHRRIIPTVFFAAH